MYVVIMIFFQVQSKQRLLTQSRFSEDCCILSHDQSWCMWWGWMDADHQDEWNAGIGQVFCIAACQIQT